MYWAKPVGFVWNIAEVSYAVRSARQCDAYSQLVDCEDEPKSRLREMGLIYSMKANDRRVRY